MKKTSEVLNVVAMWSVAVAFFVLMVQTFVPGQQLWDVVVLFGLHGIVVSAVGLVCTIAELKNNGDNTTNK